MRVYVEDGPHQGEQDVPSHQGDTLLLAEPGTRPVRGHTIHRYERIPPLPFDFENGWEARYRWNP